MVGRPSTEALAMAGADWSRPYSVDDDEGDDATPPAHLRAFEAFLETVVPVDMALAFAREEAAAARSGRRRQRSHREDVEEKLKLWAKAVAREARRGALGSRRQQQATTTTSPRPVAGAREAVPVVLARPPPGEPSSIAQGGSKGKGAQQHPSAALLVPSPRSGRRVVEPCQSNQPLPKQDMKCT